MATRYGYFLCPFDEPYVSRVGPEAEGFFDFYASQVLPQLRES